MNFKIWKTIRIGTGMNASDTFLKSLERRSFEISKGARDMLFSSDFKWSNDPIELDLVFPSLAELGFRKRAPLSNICLRAENYGLEPCPDEVGPQLRIQYMDQPEDDPCERCRIAMRPIRDSDKFLNLFLLTRLGKKLLLATCPGNSDSYYELNERLVFVLPRRKFRV